MAQRAVRCRVRSVGVVCPVQVEGTALRCPVLLPPSTKLWNIGKGPYRCASRASEVDAGLQRHSCSGRLNLVARHGRFGHHPRSQSHLRNIVKNGQKVMMTGNPEENIQETLPEDETVVND